MTVKRKNELLDFCKKVGIHFENLELLELAFHHRSITNEKKSLQNNERLEFLGDSVLGMVTAAYLYQNFSCPEGELSKIKSFVVSEKVLAQVALGFGIDKLLVLGRGEEMSGGRNKPAILADCMEAIIGALYIDSGFFASQKYVLSFIEPEIKKVNETGLGDYKSILQEMTQKKFKCAPKYKLVLETGPDHDKTFEYTVTVDKNTYGPVFGKTKKDAEQKAAKLAIEKIKNSNF